MFYTYILYSLKDKRTYVSFTPDLNVRLERHNNGFVKATRHRRPLKLLFHESFSTSPEARKRELYWKSGAGRRLLKEKFKALLDESFA